MNCGRQPGGRHSGTRGVCPVFWISDYNGVNGGRFGGRYCWKIFGPECLSFLTELDPGHPHDCANCHFYLQVQEEEAGSFMGL